MEKKDLRIVFMGTPEFAVGSLQRLVENGYNVVAVVTQPDKPVGRHGSVLRPSPVKEYALAHNLPVLQPVKMKDERFLEELRSYNADLQVVVAFRMLPEVVWAMPRFGTFNVHAALLPDYRGAAPINWAVINGETRTGVTTFFLDHDIDTGRIIAQREFPIPDDADVEYVYDGLMQLGAELCIDTSTSCSLPMVTCLRSRSRKARLTTSLRRYSRRPAPSTSRSQQGASMTLCAVCRQCPAHGVCSLRATLRLRLRCLRCTKPQRPASLLMAWRLERSRQRTAVFSLPRRRVA